MGLRDIVAQEVSEGSVVDWWLTGGGLAMGLQAGLANKDKHPCRLRANVVARRLAVG